MQMLQKTHFPPLLAKDYDFAYTEDFQDSDYEDGFSTNVGPYYFSPNWNSVIHKNLENVNAFCPYCGKFVDSSQKMSCKIQGTDAVCLGHKKCVQKKQNAQIQLRYQKSIYTLQKGYLETEKMGSIVGGKEYLLSASFSHPLSCYKYFQTDRKVVMGQGHVFSKMELNCEWEDHFNPNKIVLPIPQMNVKLDLKEIGLDDKHQNINFNVDLSQIFVGYEITEKQSVWVITYSNSNNYTSKIQIELIFDEKEKKGQIETMNFKYNHPVISTLPLIKLNKIVLMSKLCENKMTKSGIQNTKASSTFEEMNEEIQDQPMLLNSGFASTQKVEPPNTQEIINYSKTQAGSKELQKRLRDMKSQQVTSFIAQITPYICELLQDDYANYMVQTLVSFSNSKQRLSIFQSLKDSIVHLVCLKQGTFALQQMISFMDTQEEYMLFAKVMAQNFQEVSTNPNGNHFLRKLITLMPFSFTEVIIKTIFDNFVYLINNKNSVCVLKVMLKAITKQNPTQNINDIKKKMFDILTMNTEHIIKNEFGNYFIQEAFDLFGINELKGISEFIFSKLRPLAKEKFSSSVICKCISSYWRGTSYYDRLKSKMNTSEIVELFKNKEGNKVLLELMVSQADFSLKNKISSAISNYLPSKYNASKWIGTAGSSTVRPGEQNYLTFSDAMKDCEQKISPMAKKRNYIIH